MFCGPSVGASAGAGHGSSLRRSGAVLLCRLKIEGWGLTSPDFRWHGLGARLSQRDHALSPCMCFLVSERQAVHLPGYTENGIFRKSDYLYSSMSESKREVEGVRVLIKTRA